MPFIRLSIHWDIEPNEFQGLDFSSKIEVPRIPVEGDYIQLYSSLFEGHDIQWERCVKVLAVSLLVKNPLGIDAAVVVHWPIHDYNVGPIEAR